jgi:putative N6-adenine-specific DNA methylase
MAIHVIDTTARFYLELQGEPLNQRGYRQREVEAPVKETIAASLLRFAWYDGRKPMHDPFCGSGTIAIEAAMIATDTAPGLLRKRFGFERWGRFAEVEHVWNETLDEARQRAKKVLRGVIIGSDADRNAVVAARVNARNIGIDGIIFKQQDGRTLEPFLGGGTFVTNPPWGERIDPKEGSLEALYAHFGESLAACAGHTAAVFAPGYALKNIALKPVASRRVFNGPIECRMAIYEMGGSAPGQFDGAGEPEPPKARRVTKKPGPAFED